MTQAYPLHWPEGFPRAKHRERGAFKTPLKKALANVQDSLRLFGSDSGKPVTDVVLSSNVSLGLEKPLDPGVAAWFRWDGEQICIPVDRYDTTEANLQAIHHILEARRVELRHGTLALVRATMTGLKLLPAPPGEHWSQVLGVATNAPIEAIETAYRELARQAHPDRGGSADTMARLNRARDLARKERA